MISFNGRGYESATGEPNTWEPRVTSLKELIPPPVVSDELWEKISRREIDACFSKMEQEDDQRWRGLEKLLPDAELEKMQQESRWEYRELMHESDKSLFLAREHLQAKKRHAERREENLRRKRS